MKVNKYYPLASLYFFLNSFLLPLGLLYTSLLFPFFYLWLVLKKQQYVILKFTIVLAPFAIAHLINGVDFLSYFRSLILFFSVYIFCYAFYLFVNQYTALEKIFKFLIYSNFLVTFIAIILFFTSYKETFWYINSISGSLHDFPRLKLLTYEASYYSLLLVPLVFYCLVQIVYSKKEKESWLLLLMLLVPLVLSFSMGVISGILLATGLFFFKFLLKIRMKKRVFNQVVLISLIGLIFIVILFTFFRNNPLFVRIEDIFKGTDTSAKGRTFEAFLLAYKIAQEKSLFFGVGLGQLKIVGKDIIMNYYNYPSTVEVVSIPNAAAETLAVFGFLGLFLRLAIQLVLYLVTGVYNNPYRFLLFTFAFIYQFTGSYITNIVEYVIWLIAFSNCFREFENLRIPKKYHEFRLSRKNFHEDSIHS